MQIMFKFNFVGEQDTTIRNSSNVPVQVQNEEIEFKRIEEIFNEKNYLFKVICVETLQFFIRDFENEEKDCDEFLTKYDLSCDVTPFVYEGGLKVWECTYDLLSYLHHSELNFKSKTILDLGCGCGLIGIHAALQGADTVHFHDYNADVLSKFTIPNVVRNNIKSHTKFIYGDWVSFCDLPSIRDVLYDYILSSEILYNTTNYPKLLKIFTEKLNKKGKIIIASKSYYFGVGGSTKLFYEFLRQEKQFQWNVLWDNVNGVRREIVCITFK